MASIFTYDPNPPRVSSPWSTPGTVTPQHTVSGGHNFLADASADTSVVIPTHLDALGIFKLEPEPQEGDPKKPVRLLPGLEESQGALYEIGVSDDGYFIGLTEDELDESLLNLRAMAASLGCVVEVLKRVVVGSCEWIDLTPARFDGQEIETQASADLLVAEALVRPDLHFKGLTDMPISRKDLPFSDAELPSSGPREEKESVIDQLRLSLVGPSTSGKSSLLGTLTSSILDNGRGKSRLGLLKHRHEISSGITSSVAQDVVGYAPASHAMQSSVGLNVVNYATGDVTSWNDIHNLVPKDGRLAFVSDSPGLSRYSKSIIRTLVSWNPHCVVLCVAADEDEDVPSQAYLELCKSLELPVAVTITKVDIASKQGLKQTLARLLSALKASGAKPTILTGSAGMRSAESSSPIDLQHIATDDTTRAQALFSGIGSQETETVPIVLTSAVTGLGISQLHGLIHEIRIPRGSPATQEYPLFLIDEVYTMPSSKVYSESQPTSSTSTILCGHLMSGRISAGETFLLGPFAADLEGSSSPTPFYRAFNILSLRNLRLPVRTLLPGQVGTIAVEASRLQPAPKPRKGMILTSPDFAPTAHAGFTATFSSKIFTTTDSPPLILGGHALAYFHSVRAPVKVASVAFTDPDSLTYPPAKVQHSPSEADGVFTFDEEKKQAGDIVKISFEFLGGLEWLKVGQKVLIMPNVMTTTSEPDSGGGGGTKGLVGFVGKICECN
ncbi:MAG: hypothetical protein Q9160_008893 [Pyrenula sp. 1 TL-2023]